MLSVQFYGVRGSHPVPDARMMRYGGNTSCVAITKTNNQGKKVPIIIDAGSGLIPLGYFLAGKLRSDEYCKDIPLLFTHLHPDHTEGFNFFLPIYFPSCTIYIMGMKRPTKHIGMIIKEKMLPTTFPIEYKDLKSIRKVSILKDGQIFYITQDGKPAPKAENPLFVIQVMQAFVPSHPQQGAMYYRINDPDDGTSIACVWDIESHIGGDARVINFTQNASLMIHDTQYTQEEYNSRTNPVQGFGHSTYEMALENAEQAGIKNLVSFHYHPRHSDDFLDDLGKKHKRKRPVNFIMSHEGLCLTLDKGKLIQQETVKQGFAL
jgi:ribonuclease BN (tRNA processing enzyme)